MMDKLLELLEREDGCLSIGRICALATYALWLIVTVYLVARDSMFAHYDTLTIAAVGVLLVQVANKAVESKMFTIKTETAATAETSVTGVCGK